MGTGKQKINFFTLLFEVVVLLIGILLVCLIINELIDYVYSFK